MSELEGFVFPDEFARMIGFAIDEEGVYPHQGFSKTAEGKLEIGALALDYPGCLKWFWDKVCIEGASEVIFGIDRTTKEGQGTEFADVITLCHWQDPTAGQLALDGSWGNSFRIGVINYQHEPRIVRPIDWENEFWIGRMTEEVKHFRPQSRIKVVKANAPEN